MAGAVVGDVEEGDADDEIDIAGGGDGGAKGDGGGAAAEGLRRFINAQCTRWRPERTPRC